MAALGVSYPFQGLFRGFPILLRPWGFPILLRPWGFPILFLQALGVSYAFFKALGVSYPFFRPLSFLKKGNYRGSFSSFSEAFSKENLIFRLPFFP